MYVSEVASTQTHPGDTIGAQNQLYQTQRMEKKRLLVENRQVRQSVKLCCRQISGSKPSSLALTTNIYVLIRRKHVYTHICTHAHVCVQYKHHLLEIIMAHCQLDCIDISTLVEALLCGMRPCNHTLTHTYPVCCCMSPVSA